MNARKNVAVSIALAIGVSLATNALSDPPVDARGKRVPAYVTAHHDQPRMRSIHANKAIVRSGPSDQHYSTRTLTKGSQVEVYLETSDGWSAIRPPAGEHDWIPANLAYLLPGGKAAEIIQDDVPSWIGSESPDVRELAWTIGLKKTQQVKILGEELQAAEDGTKHLWFRIAPPPGEFRWVKTSQLSDSIIPPEVTSNAPSSVQLASFSSDPSDSSLNPVPDGKIVWSNEQEVLAQVEQQIKNEQSLSQQGVTTGEDANPAFEVPSSPDYGTKLRPIPRGTHQRTLAAEHQTDSFKQWDAMQNSDNAKLRVGPMRNILGLIGISVVEAERAPAHARIAQSYHANANQNHLGQIGPVGTNRLDRLPRPTRRTPTMTSPMEDEGSWLDIPVTNPTHDLQRSPTSGGTVGYTSPYQPSPFLPAESTFSRWLKGREPLFGNNPAIQHPTSSGMMQQTVGAATPWMGTSPQLSPNTLVANSLTMNSPPVGSNLANSPLHPGIPQDTSAWHGFPQSTSNNAMGLGRDRSYDESTQQLEEFQTPEIQSALVSLTQEVASPTEEWDLTSLRLQAKNWIENGSTAMVRGEARLLMERIDRFESLRLRTLGMFQNASMLAQQSVQGAVNQSASNAVRNVSEVGVTTASATQSANPSNDVCHASGQMGDASGWLVQVHGSIPGKPEFALTDDAGNVIAYVQSTAALNLRRYLQQPVKIYGVRGYLPSLAAKQILAERVQRLR